MVTTPSFDELAARLRELVGAGRFSEALAAFRAAPPAVVAHRPDLALLAAAAAMRIGDVEGAGSLASGALAAFRGRGDLDGQMRALNLVGVVAFERGRMAEAEKALAGALRLARELDDVQLAARASNNLASVSHLQGRVPEALDLYRGALASYERLGDRRGAAETYHNLGIAFRQMGDWRAAHDAILEARRHAEVAGAPDLLALVAIGRAELGIETGDEAVATVELERAGQLAVEAEDEIGAAEVRRLRALAALRQGRLEVALSEGAAAHREAERCGAALLRAEVAAVLALALLRAGRVAEGEERRREAVEGYRALGAALLESRLEQEWKALFATRASPAPRGDRKSGLN